MISSTTNTTSSSSSSLSPKRRERGGGGGGGAGEQTPLLPLGNQQQEQRTPPPSSSSPPRGGHQRHHHHGTKKRSGSRDHHRHHGHGNTSRSPGFGRTRRRQRRRQRRLEDDVPFYSRPHQRQLMYRRHSSSLGEYDDHCYHQDHHDDGDDDENVTEHHGNRGDLYWDLFFVSGAFNLSSSLAESHGLGENSFGIGFLYFVSCYLALLRLWYDKCAFDGRYTVEDNLSWRIIQIINYCLLGTAVQHIRPVSQMSHTTIHPTMIVFSASLLGTHAIHFHQDYDILMNLQTTTKNGSLQARINARNDMVQRIPPFLCLFLALTLAARDYCGGRNINTNTNNVFAEDTTTNSFLLQEEEEDGPVNHWPIILILMAFVMAQISMLYVQYVVATEEAEEHPSKNQSPSLSQQQQQPEHSTTTIPINLEHVIHRMGDFVVLMLGESVLALLVVEQSDGLRYYLTFYSGIITLTLFQYLYYRSNPFDPNDHAVKRSSIGALFFFYGVCVYSASLILVGCSFVMILQYYLQQEQQEQQQEGSSSSAEAETEEAAVTAIDDNDEVWQQKAHAIANLYCWSCAMAFFSLDCIFTSHRGIVANLKRLRNHGTTTITTTTPSRRTAASSCAWKPTLSLCVDFGLTIMVATLSQWIHDLETITLVGLIVVSSQVFLRTRCLRYFPVSKQAAATAGSESQSEAADGNTNKMDEQQ